MKNEFVIETGIVPRKYNKKYPISVLEVGESFAFPPGYGAVIRNLANQISLRSGKRFLVCSKQNRCWRIDGMEPEEILTHPIEKGIPIPIEIEKGVLLKTEHRSRKNKKWKELFLQMEIGESFTFPKEMYPNVYGSAYNMNKKSQKKFKVSQRHLRCWRIE